MKVHFYSISKDLKVDFISDLTVDGLQYYFMDQSLEDTMVRIEIVNENEISLTRTGQTSMLAIFRKSQRTRCHYENKMGLQFDFEVLCQEIKIEKNKIFWSYDYFIDEIYQDTYKIWLIIK